MHKLFAHLRVTATETGSSDTDAASESDDDNEDARIVESAELETENARLALLRIEALQHVLRNTVVLDVERAAGPACRREAPERARA